MNIIREVTQKQFELMSKFRGTYVLNKSAIVWGLGYSFILFFIVSFQTLIINSAPSNLLYPNLIYKSSKRICVK